MASMARIHKLSKAVAKISSLVHEFYPMMTESTRTPSGTNETSPLLGTDSNGLGYFISNQGITAEGIPRSLLINEPRDTGLTNELFCEEWDAAFGSAHGTRADTPCPWNYCHELHPKAAVHIEHLHIQGRIAALKLQEDRDRESRDTNITMLKRHGVEPLFPSAAQLDDAFPFATDPKGTGYFAAKWGKQSICLRNRPVDSGISNTDLSELMEEAFPVGSIGSASTALQVQFLQDYLGANKVQLYAPVVSKKHREEVAFGTSTQANVPTSLHP